VTSSPRRRLPLHAPRCSQVQPPLCFGRRTPRPQAADLSAGAHRQEVGRHKAGRRHLELNLGSVVLPRPLCLRFLSRSRTPPSALNLPAPLPRPRSPRAKFCSHACASPRFCGAAQLALRPRAPHQRSGKSRCMPQQLRAVWSSQCPSRSRLTCLHQARPFSLAPRPRPRAVPHTRPLRLKLAALGGGVFSAPPLALACLTLLAASFALWALRS